MKKKILSCIACGFTGLNWIEEHIQSPRNGYVQVCPECESVYPEVFVHKEIKHGKKKRH